MMKIYSFFHLNLMYSSIEESEYEEVINKCYWPLINLAEDNIPIGIEISGVTLELISNIDSSWIKKLKKYIEEGLIEIIGSGYSQLIGPLVPSHVNKWNQKIGLTYYKKYLGVHPKIALVNEMAYSSGMIEHYIKSKYESIIMEWNNPFYANSSIWNKNMRYFYQNALDNYGNKVPVIWADSIIFQKFQRYAHGEYDLDEYIDFIKSKAKNEQIFFPIYSNDVEIFNFRPGRFSTEPAINDISEWKRISDLFDTLNRKDWCELVFPSEILKLDDTLINCGNDIVLETPAQPIPVKKQEKYNINRWALTGIDDININTKCYKIYDFLFNSKNNNEFDWKELCYLWSSDFRTHITKKRWNHYVKRLNNYIDDLTKSLSDDKSTKNDFINNFKVHNDKSLLTIENDTLKVVLNKNKGMSFKQCIFKDISNDPLIGTLKHGYYDDITVGADFYSAHSVIERQGEHKSTDLNCKTFEISNNKNKFQVLSNYETKEEAFNQKIKLFNSSIVIEKKIKIQNRKNAIVKPFSFTLIPDSWNRETLYLETHNGGYKKEIFNLGNNNIHHGNIYSSLISARHGFGNTEGTFIVGDKDKRLVFECKMSKCALIPSIICKEIDDSFFFRLQYSAKELDDTVKSKQNLYLNPVIKIFSTQ